MPAGTIVSEIAKCRAEINGARLLVLNAALMVSWALLVPGAPYSCTWTDRQARGEGRAEGNRYCQGRAPCSRTQVLPNVFVLRQFVVPKMACDVVDRAMQAFGAEGISQDQELARLYAGLRTLRYADVSLPPCLWPSPHALTHAPPGSGRGRREFTALWHGLLTRGSRSTSSRSGRGSSSARPRSRSAGTRSKSARRPCCRSMA
jgi:hypothetical protein